MLLSADEAGREIGCVAHEAHQANFKCRLDHFCIAELMAEGIETVENQLKGLVFFFPFLYQRLHTLGKVAAEGKRFKILTQQLLFEDTNDYRYYLRKLEFYCMDTEVLVCAYCLMDNHVHLLVKGELKSISLLMKKYAFHFHLVQQA